MTWSPGCHEQKRCWHFATDPFTLPIFLPLLKTAYGTSPVGSRFGRCIHPVLCIGREEQPPAALSEQFGEADGVLVSHMLIGLKIYCGIVSLFILSSDCNVKEANGWLARATEAPL